MNIGILLKILSILAKKIYFGNNLILETKRGMDTNL